MWISDIVLMPTAAACFCATLSKRRWLFSVCVAHVLIATRQRSMPRLNDRKCAHELLVSSSSTQQVVTIHRAATARQEKALSPCSPFVQARARRLATRATPLTDLTVWSHTVRFCTSGKKGHVAHRASPRHCLAHARCPAPCTRAHACTARSTRTLDACELRQRMHMHSHSNMRSHTSKAFCGSSCHWQLADCRPVRC